MNKLETVRIFCAAAEASSFKEAAASLGVSPQVVTRAVKELEHMLGEPLFYRNTRQMRITDFGEQFALKARNTVAGIDSLFKRNSNLPQGDMEGTVRITAPTTIGRRFLVPVLSTLAIDYPQITIDLRLSDSISDVVEEQIDIGVRVGFLRDNSFIARAAAKISFFAVASPELIARTGKPGSIADLLQLPTVSLVDKSTGKRWPWYFKDSQQFIPQGSTFITDDAETELDLVLKGVGFGQIGDCLARPYLQSGRLVTVLHEHAPQPWELYVYRPQRRPVPARIRLVYEKVLQAFSGKAFLLGE